MTNGTNYSYSLIRKDYTMEIPMLVVLFVLVGLIWLLVKIKQRYGWPITIYSFVPVLLMSIYFATRFKIIGSVHDYFF